MTRASLHPAELRAVAVRVRPYVQITVSDPVSLESG